MYMCMYLCLCECMLHVYEYFHNLEDELHPLELELQVIDSCLTCVLETELRTSRRVPFLNAKQSLQILPCLMIKDINKIQPCFKRCIYDQIISHNLSIRYIMIPTFFEKNLHQWKTIDM